MELPDIVKKAVDKKPSDDTRAVACQDPSLAYTYAANVDKCPRDDTRSSACAVPHYAYSYALMVDKCQRDDTKNASKKNSTAYWRYCREVPK